MESADESAVYLLNMLLLSPVIVFGLIGNCLSMLTWSRGCHRDTSTAVLLTALAVADTIVLTIPALERWISKIFDFLIRHDSVFTCKTWAFLSYFGPTVSSWIIVIVTAERFVSIWFPVKVRLVCTRYKVKMAMLVMCVIIAALYCPFIYSAKLFKNFEGGNENRDMNSTNVTYRVVCDIPTNETFHDDYLQVWMWLDMCILFMVPFVLIVIGNSLILYKIFKSRTVFIKDGRYISCRTRVANSFTIRAIALSITFLVCLLPVTSYEVIYTHTDFTIPVYAYDFIHILLYGNSAFNFILYCAIGSGFRKDLKAVIGNLCSRKRIRLNHMDSNLTQVQTRQALFKKRNSDL